jgi:CRISPR system Cascade subunit CasE
MYLTRGYLNPRSRDVLRDLAEPADLHRSIMRLFSDGLGETPRAAAGVLHRIDTGPIGERLLVLQSKDKPDLSRAASGWFVQGSNDPFGSVEGPSIRRIRLETLRRDEMLAFRLVANATRKILTKTPDGGSRTHGKRVPLRDDALQLAWVERKLTDAGVRLERDSLRIEPAGHTGTRHAAPNFVGIRYEGCFTIDDDLRLRQALERGIGPAKAFGYGLLSVVRREGPPLYEPA